MLVEFQQALADLVASPDFCRQIRATPLLLHERYVLSEREHERLVKIVNHKAMALNCMLYRANRLAPLAMNLHEFCTLLGPRLGPLLSEYAVLYPNTNVHFYLECDRFCQFVQTKLSDGYELEREARAVLEKEHSKIQMGLMASYTAV
jgi:hypothetical protein